MKVNPDDLLCIPIALTMGIFAVWEWQYQITEKARKKREKRKQEERGKAKCQ